MAFELVTQNAWEWACKKLGYEFEIPNTEDMKDLIPHRATFNSAGYDFKMPFDYVCEANTSIIIATGIKWDASDSYLKVDVGHFDENNISTTESSDIFDNSIFVKTIKLNLYNPVLMIYPRSSLAFEYGFKLDNTCAIIDADYYNNIVNQGNIIIKFTVEKELKLKRGDKFCQGIILPYAISEHEINPHIERIGGIGSTNN